MTPTITSFDTTPYMNSPAQPSHRPSPSLKTSALIRTLNDIGFDLKIEAIETPAVGKTQALIQVGAIGLCRTDFYAISGEIETKAGALIPGHEFSGTVIQTGKNVDNISPGDRVVINPIIACGTCPDCQSNQAHSCSKTEFMGVDLDGACRDHLVVEANACHRFPEHISFETAAFAEPVAATTAIAKANLSQTETGLLIGNSRISKLTERVLAVRGFNKIQTTSLEAARQLESDQFDFVIEADASTEVVREMTRLIRPRGKLILKSRQHRPIQWVLREMIPKEPTIQMVNYGRFDEAVELIVSGQVRIDDLIGRRFPLQHFATALKHAAANEKRKTFLNPGDHA